MKRAVRLSLAVISIFFSLDLPAQVDESRNFVYLSSDSVVYGRNVRLRSDMLNSWQLRVDSVRYPLSRVKFFNMDEGFFATTPRLNFYDQKRIAERVAEGKINLFRERNHHRMLYDNQWHWQTDRGDIAGRGDIADSEIFYNKGLGKLKRVNYDNLRMDMADNAESMDLLKGYRKNARTGNALYIAAGASIVAASVAFLSTGNNFELGPINSHSSHIRPDYTATFVLMGLGTGLAVGGLVKRVTGTRKLKDAIELYNR